MEKGFDDDDDEEVTQGINFRIYEEFMVAGVLIEGVLGRGWRERFKVEIQVEASVTHDLFYYGYYGWVIISYQRGDYLVITSS